MELIDTTHKKLNFLLTMCLDKKLSLASMYLNHTEGCNTWLSRKAVSILSINKQASGGGKLGTNTVQEICCLICPLNSKKLFFRIKSAIPISSSVGIACSSLLSSIFLRAFNPALCGMLGDKLTTSAVSKIAFSSIEPKLLVFLIKSPDSLMYKHPL